MSSTKNHRRGKLQEKSSSFHGKPSQAIMETLQLRRPSTQPNLLSTSVSISKSTPSENVANRPPKPTKLLLNVTMLGSFGPVHVVMSMDSTVADLIASAVRHYVKEGRRPVLPTTDPSRFNLHYSQFCLECEFDFKYISLAVF